MATNYTYTTGIPVATNTPAQDQPNMAVNTTSVSQILSTDHLTFGAATGALTDGMHTVIHLKDNGGVTPPKVAGTGEVYSNDVTFNAKTDGALFYQSSTLAGNTEIQITAPKAYSSALNGYSFLPGGSIIQWGFENTGSSGSFAGGSASGTVTFPLVYPNNAWMVVCTPYWNTAGTAPSVAGSATPNGTSVTTTGFEWQFNSTSNKYRGFYWYSIGN